MKVCVQYSTTSVAELIGKNVYRKVTKSLMIIKMYTERKKFSKLLWVFIILTSEYRHTDK